MDRTYIYRGPLSAVTLAATAPGGERSVQLVDGGQVTLPDDHDYVRCLVARGHLQPVTAPEPVTMLAVTPEEMPEVMPEATSGATPDVMGEPAPEA